MEKKSVHNLKPENKTHSTEWVKTQPFSSEVSMPELLVMVSNVVKLWDDFDVAAIEMIVAQLGQFSQKVQLSYIPRNELLSDVFNNSNRRRLLHFGEFRRLLPQLETLITPPIGYNVTWRQVQKCQDDPRIIAWFNQHNLVTNPFGCDIRMYPFYPNGAIRPDPNKWELFLTPTTFFAHCPSIEDVLPLAYLLREECLPTTKHNHGVVKTKQHVFPILVPLAKITSNQLPLVALAHAAAQAWLEILPFSPEAMLNLSLATQVALLELLCWSVGAKETLVSLLQQTGLHKHMASGVLTRKIIDFECHFSASHQPQDFILLSWLQLRPPDLEQTYLIFVDAGSTSLKNSLWFEHINSLIPTLSLNGVVIKIIASSPEYSFLAFPEIQLLWSDEQLKNSLISQFDVAMNEEAKNIMGQAIRFSELFGPGATDNETTEKIISASRQSLARMLALGNRLVKKHCEQESPEKYLSPNELDDILKVE